MVQLLNPNVAAACYFWMLFVIQGVRLIVGDVNLERFHRWLWNNPLVQAEVLKGQPPLSAEIEALFAEYQRQMDSQYQVSALRREILKLPALPEEGY